MAQPDPQCPTEFCSMCGPTYPCREDCHICDKVRFANKLRDMRESGSIPGYIGPKAAK